MSDRPLIELKGSLEEAIGWLRRATEAAELADVEGYERGGWPALDRLADRLRPLLTQLEAALPLEAELEASMKAEWDRMDAYDSPEAMGFRS